MSRQDALAQQSHSRGAPQTQSEKDLQRAIELSRASYTQEEQMRQALAASRKLAEEKEREKNVSANLEQLRTALALSKSMSEWAPPPTWAKGVGTAFEALELHGAPSGGTGGGVWTPITHPDIIDMLGRLCACNPIEEVEYTVSGRLHKTTMRSDGMLAQVEVASGAVQLLRLVPFFFEFEASRGVWQAFTEPEAITALTAILASSKPRTYKCTTNLGEQSYETSLMNEQGMMLQRNLQSGTTRSVRATPVGPDGQPHFEYLEREKNWKPGLSNWSPVNDEVARMLALCAAGHGDCFYGAGQHRYKATLTADGFIDQINLETKAVRPIRPAPWLGHGNTRVTDATDGWVPTAVPVAHSVPVAAAVPQAEPVTQATPISLSSWAAPLFGADGQQVAVPAMQPAANFLQPQAVPMGTAVNPVTVPLGVTLPPITASYYYQPQADETIPMGTVIM